MQSSRLFWAAATLVAVVMLAFGSRGDDKAPAKLEQKEMLSAPSEIAGKTFEQWRADLKHEDPSVREKAIRAIILFGPGAAPAIPDLVGMVGTERDASPRLRAVIALTVLEIPEKDRSKVIEAFNGRLEDVPYPEPQGIVKYHAALGLTRFGEEAKAAIPGLVKAVADKSSFDTRRVAVMALRRIARDHKTGPDPRATKALLDRLAPGVEPAMEVKIEVMISLGVMGRPANKADLESVEKTLRGYAQNSSNKVLVIWAHYGLMAHGEVNDKDLDAIAKYAVKNSDVVTKIHAVTALGSVGSKGRNHVEVVCKMVDDKEGEVFLAACGALVNIGGETARRKLTEIAEAKDDADPKPDPVRKEVAKVSLQSLDKMEKSDTTEVKDKKDGK
jgi:hypothetical protein